MPSSGSRVGREADGVGGSCLQGNRLSTWTETRNGNETEGEAGTGSWVSSNPTPFQEPPLVDVPGRDLRCLVVGTLPSPPRGLHLRDGTKDYTGDGDSGVP